MSDPTITFIEVSPQLFTVKCGDKDIGNLYMEVDGFMFFEPRSAGSWEAWSLRVIADELNRLNKPWEEQISNDPCFNANPPEASKDKPPIDRQWVLD